MTNAGIPPDLDRHARRSQRVGQRFAVASADGVIIVTDQQQGRKIARSRPGHWLGFSGVRPSPEGGLARGHVERREILGSCYPDKSLDRAAG